MPSSQDSLGANGHHYTNGHQNGHSDSVEVAENVGIVAMEVYFPNNYVEQSELEVFDGVSAGKYTVGNGQQRMGFCTDREDIVSMCLTVVDRLMKRTGTSYSNIGRLAVGTETLIDKSKSVKTHLMSLFEESGNADVGGIDCVNACYGGTEALFTCCDWVSSPRWDGRYALVVAADIAVYRKGNARCTGGAGAVAMLIGPNAGLVFDQGVDATFMKNAYDFYKPNMSSEYPTVDGPLSIRCYMEALDNCYGKFCEKFDRRVLHSSKSHRRTDLSCLDFVVFHSPFTKLVQKSMGRLFFQDYRRIPSTDPDGKYAGLEKYREIPIEDTYTDNDLHKLLVKLTENVFEEKTGTAQRLARNVGNMYTASLYGGVASLIAGNTVESLVNKRVGMFSYGSGSAATFFSARFVPSRSLNQLVQSLNDLYGRLDQRRKATPEEYDKILARKELQYKLINSDDQAEDSKTDVFPLTPTSDISSLTNDSYYLTLIDKARRRFYTRTGTTR